MRAAVMVLAVAAPLPARGGGGAGAQKSPAAGLPGIESRKPAVQRLLNCGARLAACRPYFNRLSDDFP